MSDQTFDPAKHIMKIKGKDYLETKWRLVWLRSVHPNASVETELVRADERGVTIRADVSWPVIMHEAEQSPLHIVHNTGYAMEPWEKPNRIGAALENAETSAVGRALAAAGFGTQFAPELDFDAGGDRVADSPVEIRQNAPQARQRPHGGQYAQAAANATQPASQPPVARQGDASAGDLITPKQVKYLHWKASDNGWSEDELHAYLSETFGVESSTQLTKADASKAIDHVQGITEPAPVV